MSVGRTLSKLYRKLNTKLHRSAPHYGRSAGEVHARIVRELMDEFDAKTVLDYGCGKRTLQAALKIQISNYDPCIPQLSAAPAPADIVACIEVLEHVEPQYLAALLTDLRRLTKKALFATVAVVPSTKILDDGRNSHLIVQPEAWWFERLAGAGFTVRDIWRHEFGFYFTAR